MLRTHLDPILLADDPRARLTTFVASQLCRAQFPELPALAMDGDRRHKDVLAHSIEVTAKVPRRLLVRLAALLHDLGKPATRHIAKGEVTFRQHEAIGAQQVRRRLPLLGYTDAETARVATEVEMSGRFKAFSGGWTDSAVRRYAADAGDALDDLLDLCEVDVTSRHRHKHDEQAAQVRALRRRIAQVAAKDQAAAQRPDLDGDEVMRYLRLAPGPAVGAALAVLLDAKRQAGRPLTREEAYQTLDRCRPDGT